MTTSPAGQYIDNREDKGAIFNFISSYSLSIPFLTIRDLTRSQLLCLEDVMDMNINSIFFLHQREDWLVPDFV